MTPTCQGEVVASLIVSSAEVCYYGGMLVDLIPEAASTNEEYMCVFCGTV